MNTPNNKRKRESQEKIEKVFVQLVQTKEINEVSVTDICKKAKLNRSTFYANYLDIYDLADKIKENMVKDIIEIYTSDKKYQKMDFTILLELIKDNPLFFKTYFKLANENDALTFGYDEDFASYFYKDKKYLDYHLTFFYAGFNAIVKKWINNGFKETPEVMNKILEDEYKNKNINM